MLTNAVPAARNAPTAHPAMLTDGNPAAVLTMVAVEAVVIVVPVVRAAAAVALELVL